MIGEKDAEIQALSHERVQLRETIAKIKKEKIFVEEEFLRVLKQKEKELEQHFTQKYHK